MPLECWLIAGGLYLVIVTATQSMTNARTWLGFPHTLDDEDIDSGAVIDVGALPAQA